MRDRLRTTILTAVGLLAAAAGLVGGGPAPAASAAPTGLYAPSALVLTLAPGRTADRVSRAVTLSCAPTPSGTHPAPAKACARLAQSGGSLRALKGERRFCPALADPVTVTADGVWRGRRVSYRETFGNHCALLSARGEVFDF
ncbi:subtilase-type protease inhibitor [Peterkaempfera sp. SMS 1(5)a]|uniref:subtilase-type protease inhibitor n=1 Tax=Peterkaempfera podocarpi TaxID=3232308 RepID=UPI00366CB131